MNLTTMFQKMPIRYPELAGEVALVTGANRGIGAAIAVRLAREGMRVMMGGLEADELDAAVQELRALGADVEGVAGNLVEPGAAEALFDKTIERFGGLYLLVNNAADLRRTYIEKLSWQLIDDQMYVNSRVPLLLSMRAAEVMKAAGKGNMVNISSVGGLRAHLPGLPYSMNKAALDAMTRSLAVELGAQGIRVNAIGPGFTPSRGDPETDPEYAAMLAHQSKMIPLQKPCKPEDIGAMTAFLASDDAACVTGQTIYVDGGLVTQLHPPGQPI
jgi:3-oxoacyl-[acyl-carrier protein] reductase